MFVKTVEFVISAYHEKDFPRPLYGEVCFVGRSNVGKSSLLNVLFNKKLAKVSKRPGKTRSINFYEVNRKHYFVICLVMDTLKHRNLKEYIGNI